MKVALLTTWNERCGIAEYARKLVANCPQIDWDIIGRPQWHPDNAQSLYNRQFDVLAVNYEPGLFSWLKEPTLDNLRAMGRKTVLILHTSHEGDNRSWPLVRHVHRVVMHEHTANKTDFDFIPMGIPEVRATVPYEMQPYGSCDGWTFREVIGTAGFPFPSKGFPEVAQAAAILKKPVLVFAPQSDHCDTAAVELLVAQRNPQFKYITGWMPEETVIDNLARCQVNVFAYHGFGGYGISGAVRMGLAAKRPLVLTRPCRQFRDLLEYEDEIEFADSASPEHLVQAIERVLANGKKPKRVLEDMSWTKVGKLYESLFQSLEG